ncbi:MAG: hypothetical protein AAF668_06290 [Pseudomonadota bacterium]
MEYELSPRDYIAIIKKRIAYFVIPFLCFLALGIVISIKLPARYEALGVILVESQQIPTDLIQSTVTGLADERIQIIQQRVMTRQNLLRIIERFDLFKDDLAKRSISEKVDIVRDNISVELVSAESGRRQRNATIAFKLAYSDKDPNQSLNVVNELITLFLDENVRTRTARASETTEFLESESDKLREELEALEAQVAEFKSVNANALPDNLTLNLDLLERSQNDLQRVQADRKALEEEIRFIRIELAATQTGTTILPQATGVLSPAQQLSQARSELVSLRIQFSDLHPDVVATKDRIRALEAQLNPNTPRVRLRKELQAAQGRLSALLSTTTADDERIAETRDEIASIEQKLEALPLLSTVGQSDFDVQSARLEGRMAASKARIDVFVQAESDLRARVAELQDRILQTPEVERALATLMRDYENSRAKYEEIKSKQLGAQLAENLEEGRKAERFLLIEPPILPTEPTSPNRPALVAGSFVLAGGIGAAILALSQFLFGGVTSPSMLSQITRQPLIAVIPEIKTKADIAREKLRLKIYGGASAAVPVVTLALIHFFYSPLDVLWYRMVG